MTDSSPRLSDAQATPPGADCKNLNDPVVSSAALLGDRRELLIRHGNENYRLRLTRQDKLILTK